MALRVWLPLNGNLNNLGLSNIQFTNENTSNIVIDNNGKIGKCYKRTTKLTAGRIKSTTTMNFNSDLSICCWALVTECVGDTANGLVTMHSHGNNTGFGITVKQVSTTDYRISCSTGKGNDRTYMSYYGTSNIKGAWHHLALTYNHTMHIFELWVDGIVEKTQSYTNASQNDYIMLFDWSTTFNDVNYRPACSLNDVRIYDHCLSAKEVQEIAKGLVLHYKLDDPYLEVTTNLGNTSSTYSNMTLENAYSASGWGGDAGTVTYYSSGGYCGGPYKVYHKTAAGSGGIYRKTANDITIVAGKTYTMSIYVKASREFTDLHYSFNINGVTSSKSNYYITYGQSIHFTTEWLRLVKTFTATSADAGTFGEMSIVYNDDVADYYIYYSCFLIEEKDHATLYTNNKRPNTPNLVNGLLAGGRTTVNGNNIVTTGENADTYFYLKLSLAMILNHRYKLSCFASGITSEQGFTFPVAGQSNTTPGQLSIKNGYNELIFIANALCVNVGTSVILDDTSRPSTPTVCTFSEFCLQDLTEDIIDSSGYGYNGSAYGKTDYQSTTPKYSGSMIITDTTSHIVTPTILTGGFLNTYTIAWWSKCPNWSGKMQWGSVNGNRLNGVYSCYWNTSDGSSNPIYKPGTTTAISEPTRNVWHHLAMTGNGSKCYLYVDGILYGEAKTYKGLTGTLFYINGWANSSNYCYNDLSISDFRIYSTALSAAAVKDLYDTSAEIDNKGNLFVREVVEK